MGARRPAATAARDTRHRPEQAADTWIVLDDVQLTRRDYQHRTRLAALPDPDRTRWLSMPTHLPQGRQTAIRNALIADPAAARRRTETMIRQEYRTSPHWSALQTALEPVWAALDTGRTGRRRRNLHPVLLGLLGWPGRRQAAARTSPLRCSSLRRKPRTARSSPCGSPPTRPTRRPCTSCHAEGVFDEDAVCPGHLRRQSRGEDQDDAALASRDVVDADGNVREVEYGGQLYDLVAAQRVVVDDSADAEESVRGGRRAGNGEREQSGGRQYGECRADVTHGAPPHVQGRRVFLPCT
ncbi:WbqC family protein [Streptomyces lavenduligriseus]|nr:WbqC family protein [Streptomyces lavenduligriseus]